MDKEDRAQKEDSATTGRVARAKPSKRVSRGDDSSRVVYAIIESGGKQYRVAPGERLQVEKLSGEVGASVEFNNVLFVGADEEPIMDPVKLKETRVVGTILGHLKSEKVLVFKFKRRKMIRRLRGHRQNLTEVQIDQVSVGSEAPSKPAKATRKTAAKDDSVGEKEKKAAPAAKTESEG